MLWARPIKKERKTKGSKREERGGERGKGGKEERKGEYGLVDNSMYKYYRIHPWTRLLTVEVSGNRVRVKNLFQNDKIASSLVPTLL